MRVTRPVSLSPTRRHDWKPCTGWRLDARLTVGRCLPQAPLKAYLKSLPFVNTYTLARKREMQADTTIFFDFLKVLKFNGLRDFLPFLAQKKLRTRPKNAKKNGRRKPPNGAYPLPSTSSSKTRKKSSEIF